MLIIARNKVQDIAAFLQGHQERVELFAPAVANWTTFQDDDDANSVTMLIEVTDMKQFSTILNDPRNEALSKKHTVIKPVIVSMPAKA